MSRPRPRAALPAPQPQQPAGEPPTPADPPRAAIVTTAPAAQLPWLRDAVRRRFGAGLADDIAQETYLRLAERAPPHEPPSRGYLLTVAANLARDVFRRERVRADYVARQQAAAASAVNRHTAEDDLRVREAILALPPNLRDVLLLSKIGGLTNREIAQRCNVTVRAIDKRLQKAITLFVANLRD